MDLLQYSPEEVTIIIAGIHTVTALSAGKFVSVRKHLSPFEISRSADGEISRTYRNDQSYTVELTLAQSSPSNNVLSMLQAVDLTTKKGLFPIFIKDGSGTTTFVGTTSWISDVPEISFSTNIEERLWTFHCTQGILNIGGSGDQSLIDSILQNAVNAAPILDKLGLV
jgi:hypothetical protein